MVDSTERKNVLNLLRIGLGLKGEVQVVSDWQDIYDIASDQAVAPFVFDGFQRLVKDGVPMVLMPDSLLKTWRSDVEDAETSYILQQKTSADLALIFSSARIRTYILKGAVVSECYPDPSHRNSCDFDCFLRSVDGSSFDAWERGNQLIEQQGYPVNRGYYKNSSITLPGLLVENHKFLTPFRGNKRLKALEVLLQLLIRGDVGKDKLEGTELYRPPVMVSALFLVEHAFSHFFHEGLNLRHITDWMMFSRYHKDDIDWPAFERYVDEFGFRRFYDAYVHVGEYVLGERTENTLTSSERRMMDSVWKGLDLHDTAKGIRGKLNLVGNTLRACWKYRLFSPISMVHALWIQVKGFLFLRRPRLVR